MGLSNLQHIDLNSSRNLLIVGFGLYMGLSIPDYFSTYTAAHGHGPINTGDQDFNNVMNSIFSTAAAVTLIITLFLDNTVPGSKRERGLHIWEELMESLGGGEWWEDEYMEKVGREWGGMWAGEPGPGQDVLLRFETAVWLGVS